MTPEELARILGDTARARNPGAWYHFCKEMKIRHYGAEELRDAWEWYLSGFETGTEA
jgi:GT2 family glycosyltransferase